MIEPTTGTNDPLLEQKKAIPVSNDRVKHLRSGLQASKISAPARRFWSLRGSRQAREFMSSVCNQPIRPNTKVTTHDGRST